MLPGQYHMNGIISEKQYVITMSMVIRDLYSRGTLFKSQSSYPD